MRPSRGRPFPHILCFSSSLQSNMYLIGGLQEHCDLTSVGSYKNKEHLCTKKFATTSQGPPSPCLYKGFAILLQGV